MTGRATLLLAALLAPAAFADVPVRTEATFNVFVCADDPSRLAFTEEQKQRERCSEWRLEAAEYSAEATLSEGLYHGKNKNGNWALSAMVDQIAPATKFPKRPDGEPYSFAEFHRFYRDLGYIEIPREAVFEGVIATWPNRGAVVTEIIHHTETMVMASVDPEIEVTYGGSLRSDTGIGVSEVQYMSMEAPRYVIHRDDVQAMLQTGLHWNVWQEPRTPAISHKPVGYLKPDGEYRLVVDLSALAAQEGAFTSRPGQPFTTWLLDWVSAESAASVELELLLLTDETRIGPTSPVQTFRIDLDRIRAALGKEPSQGDYFELAKSEEFADVLFGRAAFEIDVLSPKPGSIPVGISVWHDRRPIDELLVDLCVARDDAEASAACGSGARFAQTMRGSDSIRVGHGAAPDAAVHFVELKGVGVQGVFHRSDEPGGFTVWRLGQNLDELRDDLERTYLPALGSEVSVSGIAARGSELYNELFPPDSTGRAAFERFLAKYAIPPSGESPASIYTRVVKRSSQPLTIVPFALMRVPVDAATTEFLGFRYRVESPLESQNLEPSPTCISRWYLAVPDFKDTAPDEFKNAYGQAQEEFDRWLAGCERVFPRLGEFAAWLNMPGEREKPGAAVFVLSHHDANRLYVDETESVTPGAVVRHFAHPAVAILDACGAGGATGNRFVSALNRRGVASLIAPATAIDPHMAGDYVHCLATTLDEHADDAVHTLAVAHWNAQQCLKDRKPTREGAEAYGPRALAMTLLGSGNVRLCPPRKELQ